MLQYTAHPSPFAFEDGRKKSSSAASTPRFLSNVPSKPDPRRLAVPLTQKRSVDTDLSQDRLSFSPSLSVSTSFSSLPSPSSHIEDVLSHGDIVGEGIPLLGEPLRLVANSSAGHVPAADHQEPATEFQVVRKLGTGSYAVVYLVREVLCRSPPSEDDHFYPGGRLELDDASAPRSPPTEYGREYAIKLLSKADLDEEELVAQLTEVRSVPNLSSVRVLTKIHSGDDPSVNSCSLQHCHLASYFGNFSISPSPSRICSRSRSLLLSGAGPRSLRCRSCLRSRTESHSPHPRSSLVTSSVSITVSHPSPPDRFDVRPNV